MPEAQKPPVLDKITQVEETLNSIIDGVYSSEQKDKAQQVLDSIQGYKSNFQTALDTFSDNVETQYSNLVACKSLGVSKTTSVIDSLCSSLNSLASGSFLDDILNLGSDDLVNYLDDHLAEILDLIAKARDAASSFASLIDQVNNTIQTMLSEAALLMSSISDIKNEILNSLNSCISHLMYNSSSVKDRFEKLTSVSEMPDPKSKIDKIKEIANASFDSGAKEISNSASNLIDTLS